MIVFLDSLTTDGICSRDVKMEILQARERLGNDHTSNNYESSKEYVCVTGAASQASTLIFGYLAAYWLIKIFR